MTRATIDANTKTTQQQQKQYMYYLKNRNVPARFDAQILNDLNNFEKIGDQIEALQISKRSVQTACLYLNGLKSYSTLNEIVPFESFFKTCAADY